MSDREGAAAPEAAGGLSAEATRGLPWMVVTKVLLLVVYFYISIVTVRKLGSEQYGVFSLCRNIAEYLVVICGLGLNAALLRFIPELVLNRNKAGIRRLLVRSFLLQTLLAGVATAALFAAAPLFEHRYHADYRWALLLTGVLVAAQLGKNFLNDTFTALFRTRTVTTLSTIQAVLWAALLWAGLTACPGVSMAIAAQIVSIVALSIAGGILLVRYLAALNWRSPPQGIGRRRTLALSIPVMLNGALRMLMSKYTEVFFLGLYFPATVVGVYDLGYTTPQTALTLIPISIQTLLTSAFAQSYARDPTCLPRLIRAVYKMLILAVVPASLLGFFFVPRAIVVLYGDSMAAAGPIASAFCILHNLPLISMPLSMAITAKEQVLKMLPYMIGQVAVNLLLDWLLIPRWGMAGGVAAVTITWLVTIPFRVHAVRVIVGHIPFPIAFLFRVAAVSAAVAGVLRWLWPAPGLAGLATVGVLFLAAFVVLARVLRVVRPADRDDLQGMTPGRLRKGIVWLAGAA